MKQTALVLSLSFLFFMCKKGQTDFEINGTFYTHSLNGAISNASIEVYKTNAGSAELEYYATYKTDSEGKFNFSMKRDKFTSITLRISKSNYFKVEKVIYFSDLSVDEPNYFHYFTTAQGWAKIHLKSNSQGNSLNIARLMGKIDCEECCPNGFQYFDGAFDTTIYCVNDAGTEYSFNYFINNGSITGEKSTITPFADTSNIELIF